MKLYHGTSESVAREALKHGLLPRSDSGAESLWDECPSSADHVYLTVGYAPYFARHASADGERWAIIEIDTDLLPDGDDHLYPDEDFLEQATRGQTLPAEWDVPLMTGDSETGTMAARTAWFREHLWMFGHLWEASVEGLGNCSHHGVIPPEAIVRVSYIDPKQCRTMSLLACDPFISLMNWRLIGAKYRALTEWCMGSTDVDPGVIMGSVSEEGVDYASLAALDEDKLSEDLARLPEGVRRMLEVNLKQYRAAVRVCEEERVALEVVTLPRPLPGGRSIPIENPIVVHLEGSNV